MPLTQELTRAVELQYRVKAEHEGFVMVDRVEVPQAPWRGYVHLFSITGHPTATQAFAWAAQVDGNMSYFAVLRLPRSLSPSDALQARQAVTGAETRSG